jgi:lipoate-protein ligase A
MAGRGHGPAPGGWRVEERTGDAAALHATWPGVLDHPGERALAVCRVTSPAVVLGSAQRGAVVDAGRASADGVAVARRRSGGGAVLVTPEDPVWVDVWVPVGDPLWKEDVGRAFDWLGQVWVTALGRVGVSGVSAHTAGYDACTRWARLICFGGVGTGEVVTADRRKLVGLAQRRNRDGAWFHGACYLHWDPVRLIDLLDLSAADREAAAADLDRAAVGVSDLERRPGHGGIGIDELARSVMDALP